MADNQHKEADGTNLAWDRHMVALERQADALERIATVLEDFTSGVLKPPVQEPRSPNLYRKP